MSNLWLATTRGRVGLDVEQPYLINRFLIYATGGAGFTRAATSICREALNCFIDGQIGNGWATQSRIRPGWVAGGGIETPLAPHVTVKFEYLYANFGRLTFENGAITNDVEFTEQMLRAGVNFKLLPD